MIGIVGMAWRPIVGEQSDRIYKDGTIDHDRLTATLAHDTVQRWHTGTCTDGILRRRPVAGTVDRMTNLVALADTPTAPLPIVVGKPRPAYADGSLRSPIDYWIDLADYHSQCETDLEWIRR